MIFNVRVILSFGGGCNVFVRVSGNVVFDRGCSDGIELFSFVNLWFGGLIIRIVMVCISNIIWREVGEGEESFIGFKWSWGVDGEGVEGG